MEAQNLITFILRKAQLIIIITPFLEHLILMQLFLYRKQSSLVQKATPNPRTFSLNQQKDNLAYRLSVTLRYKQHSWHLVD